MRSIHRERRGKTDQDSAKAIESGRGKVLELIDSLKATYRRWLFFGTMPRIMEPVPITLPKKPRIRPKEQQPDQRTVTIVPIRAATDRTLTPMELRVLMVLCSYTNRSGLTWVGMKRVGDHLGISISRMTRLTQGLTRKGYLRVLYKGFPGERAQTRQVIFNDLPVSDIVAVTQEPAPYMIEQQQKTQLNQQPKGQTMKKRKLSSKPVVDDNRASNLDFDYQQQSIDRIDTLRRAVGSELVDLAISRLEPKYTIEQLEQMLDRMLR